MLYDFYDMESEPIVSLEAFYGPKKHLADKCIIIFSKQINDHLLAEFECEKVGEVGACNGNRPIWMFDYNGEKLVFYMSPIGSAMAGVSIAEVNHMTGATKFIMFGSCGSLDAVQTCGKFIVPTEAYRGEGMSYYYAEPSEYIRITNADAVADIFAELKVPFVKGRVWTTDCMLRETVKLVNNRKSEGCIAVEMELAGVQSVCNYYGCELYDFLAAGDVLAEDGYEVEGLADANHNLDKLWLALKIAERI